MSPELNSYLGFARRQPSLSPPSPHHRHYTWPWAVHSGLVHVFIQTDCPSNKVHGFDFDAWRKDRVLKYVNLPPLSSRLNTLRVDASRLATDFLVNPYGVFQDQRSLVQTHSAQGTYTHLDRDYVYIDTVLLRQTESRGTFNAVNSVRLRPVPRNIIFPSECSSFRRLKILPCELTSDAQLNSVRLGLNSIQSVRTRLLYASHFTVITDLVGSNVPDECIAQLSARFTHLFFAFRLTLNQSPLSLLRALVIMLFVQFVSWFDFTSQVDETRLHHGYFGIITAFLAYGQKGVVDFTDLSAAHLRSATAISPEVLRVIFCAHSLALSRSLEDRGERRHIQPFPASASTNDLITLGDG
ncbi:hypothetical protein C8R45DRAFT_939404 [Mycena sanguinolenta]|nr:hypothetical protein C8R45DRAFT_939404 [Mycena sanguinolenta]